MEREGCVDANVSVSGLDRNKRYYISLASERGLGFSNQVRPAEPRFRQSHRTPNLQILLPAHRLWALGQFGTVTAEVRESPRPTKLVATKTAEVTVAPERPVMGSYLHKKECLLTALFGEPSSAGGWMSNGAAYSATTALFSGVSLVGTAATLGSPPSFCCVVGALETSASSRAEGDGIHTVSVTMTKKNGDTRLINKVATCTYRFGVCGIMRRAFTN